MGGRTRRMGAVVVAVAALLATLPVPVRAVGTAKSSTFYFIGGHPDDEAMGWQLVDDFQDHYSVFVTLSQGEGTYACDTAEEARANPKDPYLIALGDPATLPQRDPASVAEGEPASGPYMYEGPGNQVNQPDL